MTTAHDINPQSPHLDAKIATLEGQLALLAKEVSMSTSNMANAIAAMQGDLRDVGRTVGNMRAEQQEMRSHSEGLDRLGKAIEKLNDRLDRRDVKDEAVNDSISAFRGGVKVLWAVVLILGSLASAYVLNEFRHVEATQARLEALQTAAERRIENRLDRLESPK